MVNLSELSINDWIWNINVNDFIQIDYIDPPTIGFAYKEDYYCCPSGRFNYCNITPQFLTANGWWYDDCFKCWYHKVFQTVYEENNDFMYSEFTIKHIHQLQHLIRLEGHVKEADNFKYE